MDQSFSFLSDISLFDRIYSAILVTVIYCNRDEFNDFHREITPHLQIEPATPGLHKDVGIHFVILVFLCYHFSMKKPSRF